MIPAMTDPSSFLIYGANGFTGELCAREAAARGLRPVLAGRNEEAVARLASELSLPHRAFPLEGDALRRGLDGVAAVLHCAGPFVHTSKPMATACLETGTHYLDITGEMVVFERLHHISDKAEAAGVALVPGVGFDVVPTDCLAARLAEKLPEATHLELAFAGDGAEWSRGTLNTMIESLPHMGAVRRDGEIVPVPPAYESKMLEFPGLGRRYVTTIPWGDVSTAYHSTGIPNIKVFSAMPPKAVARLKRIRPLLFVAGLKPVKRLIQAWVRRTVTGPGEAVRESARMYVWGQVSDGRGGVESGALSTPEGYTLTAISGVEAASRAAQGRVEPGTWTPSKAFGAGFVETLRDVRIYH
jgi:short subunit dehydrogenase-like uncharacterized protein